MEKSKKPERHLKMLIGLPGSGKSHYIDSHPEEFKGYTVLSLDNIIRDRCAQIEAETGSKPSIHHVIGRERKKMDSQFDEEFRQAIKRGDNILIDRVNDSTKVRLERNKLAKGSADYDYITTAIVIHPPEEDLHIKRLFRRSVRQESLGAMNYINRISMEPVKDNEFDHIKHIGTPPENPLFHEYKKPAVSMAEAIKDAACIGNGQFNR